MGGDDKDGEENSEAGGEDVKAEGEPLIEQPEVHKSGSVVVNQSVHPVRPIVSA